MRPAPTTRCCPRLLLLCAASLWFGLSLPALPAPQPNPTNSIPAEAQAIVLPASVPDPLEPLNRGFWAVNEGLLRGVIQPTARGYRVVVRKPFRRGINNLSRNLTYPDLLANNLLQGRWAGARDETYRFLCNTALGLGGLFDVARKFNIPKSDADFGQTFGKWGWQPDFFLMAPGGGPSNDRDALGLAADVFANPLRYLSPYSFHFNQPLTYFTPYGYFVVAGSYNALSDSVDGVVRFTKSQMDPYSEIEYAWTFVRESRVANFQVKGPPNPATLETLESVFFTYKNPAFPGRGQTRSVRLPDTGRRLKFTSWLQPKPAPVVYLIPGLGSHRLADTVLALAELVYSHGYSVVSVSSTFNYEFIEQGATVTVPGYTPVDAQDLLLGLTVIDARLRQLYPQRLGEAALMGYSMGAFQSLYLAGTQSTNRAAGLHFERFVAIDSPVRLLYGISKLDEFYRAPLAWPAEQRTADIENTFLKVATLAQYSLTPQTTLPFDAVESEFLIGFVFRVILRDAIYTSQRRQNLGVLARPLSKWRRAPVYDEILQYSYHDYLERFVIPYYAGRGLDLSAPGTLERASDLRTYQAGLRANPRLRLILNQNDFLLPPEDLRWFESLVAPGQITVFPAGGHLGNLSHPDVQRAIFHALDGLRPAAPTAP